MQGVIWKAYRLYIHVIHVTQKSMQWKQKMTREKHDRWQSKEHRKIGEEAMKNTERDP